MQDDQLPESKMYQTWSVSDHLTNIGLVLRTIADRREVTALDLADALAQIDLAKKKLGKAVTDEDKRANAMREMENMGLWDAAARYKRRAAQAFPTGFLIGGAAGYWIGVLFGVTCPS